MGPLLRRIASRVGLLATPEPLVDSGGAAVPVAESLPSPEELAAEQLRLADLDLVLPAPPSGPGRSSRKVSYRVWVPVEGRWQCDNPSFPFDTEAEARTFLAMIRAEYARTGRISIGHACHGGGGLDMDAAYIVRQTIARSHTGPFHHHSGRYTGDLFDLLVFRSRLPDKPSPVVEWVDENCSPVHDAPPAPEPGGPS